ncbi:MAG: WS/DGAT domain-containing protein, partial [Gammaproteobacteria bacterium]|nr:WS/DGAT domain-containing protein [Gammaproteobacteria bacterium]
SSMVAFLMLSGTLGYGVAVTSYNQQMIFNYISESRLLPDIEVMSEAVEEAFEELLAEARKINPPPVSEQKPEHKPGKGSKKSEKKSQKKSGKKSTKRPAA